MAAGILRIVAESKKLIVIRDDSFGRVLLHFRGKVGTSDAVDTVVFTSPVALNTMAYMAEHFKEVKRSGAAIFFERVT